MGHSLCAASEASERGFFYIFPPGLSPSHARIVIAMARKFGFIPKNIRRVSRAELQSALQEYKDGLVVVGNTQDLNDSKGVLQFSNARGIVFVQGQEFVEGKLWEHDDRVLLVHVEEDRNHIIFELVRREADVVNRIWEVGPDLLGYEKGLRTEAMMQSAFGHVFSRMNALS